MWSKKKKERIAREQSMSQLLNKELIVVTEFGKDFRGLLVDWDDKIITIQYKIDEEPVFQLRTFQRKVCKFRLSNNGLQQILNNSKTIKNKDKGNVGISLFLSS